MIENIFHFKCLCEIKWIFCIYEHMWTKVFVIPFGTAKMLKTCLCVLFLYICIYIYITICTIYGTWSKHMWRKKAEQVAQYRCQQSVSWSNSANYRHIAFQTQCRSLVQLSAYKIQKNNAKGRPPYTYAGKKTTPSTAPRPSPAAVDSIRSYSSACSTSVHSHNNRPSHVDWWTGHLDNRIYCGGRYEENLIIRSSNRELCGVSETVMRVDRTDWYAKWTLWLEPR